MDISLERRRAGTAGIHPLVVARLGARRFRKTAMLAAGSSLGENLLFLVDYLVRFLRVAVLLAIWRVVLPHHGTISGMTLGAVLTYTLIAEVFADQLAGQTQLASDFWEGTVTTRFLQPTGLVAHYVSDMCGRWIVGFILFSVPLLLVAPLLGVNPLPASPVAAALFAVSVALAVSVGVALDFVFAALTVALEQPVWLVMRLRIAIGAILSGSLLPLALLPWGLGNVFAWLPFASMASAPLQIYVGTGAPLPLLAIQLGWSLVLWPLAFWLGRAYRERMVGYGG
jgi:ABC-2 type transport system permease protein